MFEDQPRSHLFVWIAAGLLLLAVGYRFLGGRAPEPPPVEVAQPGESRAAAAGARVRGRQPRLYVHVAGAVRRPGLYRVPAGARVATALELAGGPKPRADLTTTNLAAKVQDGQQVVVPMRGRPTAAVSSAAPSTAAGPAAGPLSLATATQAQLEELDGIGPALASSIIEYRDAHGGFRSVEELGEVDGIGEVRLEALRRAVRP